MTSFSLSMYPGANEVMVETVDGSSERTPLLARSSASASRHLFHTALVRSVRGDVRFYEIGHVDLMVPTSFFEIYCHRNINYRVNKA